MLMYWLISLAFLVIGFILSPLPTVTELPLGLDSVVGEIVGDFHAVIEVLPPLQIVWLAFKIVIAVEIGLLFFKIAQWLLTFRRG